MHVIYMHVIYACLLSLCFFFLSLFVGDTYIGNRKENETRGQEHRGKESFFLRSRHTFPLLCGSCVQALLYTATEDNEAFVGYATEEEIARIIVDSVGPSGTNHEYLLKLGAMPTTSPCLALVCVCVCVCVMCVFLCPVAYRNGELCVRLALFFLNPPPPPPLLFSCFLFVLHSLFLSFVHSIVCPIYISREYATNGRSRHALDGTGGISSSVPRRAPQ